ncbi:hypothetical protein EDD86DRAFT_191129 [Gorgonomyces haynaldii]|nr:hypothetical protein EDD86DRAFT_191129 [Gorgonomyces haynaldii]
MLSFVTLVAAASIQDCPSLTPRASKPSSIRDVRIDDIKVVAAIGDSITAGFGAAGLKNPNNPISLTTLFEQRGLSFAIGGDDNAVTVPNFMKRYNPDIVGASVGEHIANICYGLICPPFQYRPSYDKFNAARSGSLAFNLDNQVDWLMGEMYWNNKVDWNNDYKLIHLLIGANDLCLGCDPILGNTVLSADGFENEIRKVVYKIKSRIPKVILNVKNIFNVSQVWDLTKDEPYCKTLRALGLQLECACAFQDNALGKLNRQKMDNLAQAYNQRLEKLRAEYLNDKQQDFLFVLDPLVKNAAVREFPTNYISNVDCFHPGLKAHELLAVGTWNNLFKPYNQKASTVPIDTALACPVAEDRIRQ